MKHVNRAQVLLSLSGLFVVAGFLSEFWGVAFFSAALYVLAAASGLTFIAPSVMRSLKRHTLDMNCLMGIAVLGALIMGFWQSRTGNIELDIFRDAAIVIFLDQIGEWLEDWSREKSGASLKELETLAPTTVNVVGKDGSIHVVKLADVREGARILIRPGERVPLDGKVVKGRSDLDESSITGESVLSAKAPGDKVYAGSLNTQGAISILVTHASGATVLDGIISEVAEAEKNRAPYEAFVTRFAKVYTPCVIAVAACVGLGAPLLSMLFGFLPDWPEWIWRALTMLVIACPCALVISTPVAFVSAISKAAKKGVLVKGGAAFDIGTKIGPVAFDKTGTVTKGKPKVERVIALGAYSEANVLSVAAALESSSTHPAAEAVRSASPDKTKTAEGIQEVPGFGVKGVVNGTDASVMKPGDENLESVRELLSEGMTVLVVRIKDEVIGCIGCVDEPRPEAAQAIAALNEEGYDTLLLSGDNERSVECTAEKLGFEKAKGALLPAQKVASIAQLQNAGERVCMVGDGINDGPALATADLGVTLGHGSSDTARSVSLVALLGSDLMQLITFFKLSKKTMRIARENIAIALMVKFGVLILSACGLAGMGAAIFADTGVMLLVVLNGLRLML